MKSPRSILLAALSASALLGACASHDGSTADHAAHAAPAPAPTTPQPPSTPHGSHDPAHGGHVLMDATYHVELVLDTAGGHHRAYVSDGARAPLPASTFDEMKLTIAGEELALARTVDDSAWEIKAKPAPTTGAKISIVYSKAGAVVARFDDLPIEYVLTGKMPVASAEPVKPASPPAHGEPGHHH